ncbi:uncharacterized protein PADG_12189 [Paracoccidioides brasiliensis Pb18]|uniref:Uncharacterized protein n=1 Tax=Paracoccidioides brasiliensis (strain Pb18) TaxID=502780 RepID=A0A0A0HUS1_PARBD|nr:uncharacterized protein PADG_12189 [Paracoccidioides brasiliensis Pb18]KGM91731.1 hypothetical protein PADG_12189 [Paracoccidioides brasiliensis Pb18]
MWLGVKYVINAESNSNKYVFRRFRLSGTQTSRTQSFMLALSPYNTGTQVTQDLERKLLECDAVSATFRRIQNLGQKDVDPGLGVCHAAESSSRYHKQRGGRWFRSRTSEREERREVSHLPIATGTKGVQRNVSQREKGIRHRKACLANRAILQFWLIKDAAVGCPDG